MCADEARACCIYHSSRTIARPCHRAVVRTATARHSRDSVCVFVVLPVRLASLLRVRSRYYQHTRREFFNDQTLNERHRLCSGGQQQRDSANSACGAGVPSSADSGIFVNGIDYLNLACVRVCVRACVRACVHACLRACVPPQDVVAEREPRSTCVCVCACVCVSSATLVHTRVRVHRMKCVQLFLILWLPAGTLRVSAGRQRAKLRQRWRLSPRQNRSTVATRSGLAFSLKVHVPPVAKAACNK